jgi:hypothetical protein
MAHLLGGPQLAIRGLAHSLAEVRSIQVWAFLWALFLSLGWLVPNHYHPWIAFHTDAWVAWAFLIGGGGLLFSTPGRVTWHRLAGLAAVLTLMPVLQFAAGKIFFAGQAWIATLYLLGFLLSLLLAAKAEAAYPDRVVEALFMAIGIAAVVSVGIQLYQWLAMVGDELWVLPLYDRRPYGNLAQPNQMATLELWGLISVAWMAHKKRIGPSVALLLASIILFGIALTQSRTAIVAILLLVAGACFWRKLWPSPRAVVILAMCLLVYFVACLLVIEPISNALLLDRSFSATDRIRGHDPLRWQAYELFAHAALSAPWFGYGWSTLAPVHIAFAQDHGLLPAIFQQSHNLFLDFVLWLGIPLGAAVSIALAVWFIRRLIQVRSPKDALLVMFVAVVGLHAMLELPLHYAYMLLPTALVMGTLDARLNGRAITHTTRGPVIALWLAAAALLALTTKEYLSIEADFEALRFEKAYNRPAPDNPPSTLLLTQLSEFMRLARSGATGGMSQAELDNLRAGTDAFPSASNLFLYTAALVMNDRPDEARLRMRKLSKMMYAPSYEELGRIWAAKQKQNKAMAEVDWLKLPEPAREARSQ